MVFLLMDYAYCLFLGQKKSLKKLISRLFSYVGSIRGSSTLCEHCESIVNFEKVLKNKINGQYRKKKLP